MPRLARSWLSVWKILSSALWSLAISGEHSTSYFSVCPVLGTVMLVLREVASTLALGVSAIYSGPNVHAQSAVRIPALMVVREHLEVGSRYPRQEFHLLPVYEGYGTVSVALLIGRLVDNKNLSTANVRVTTNGNDGTTGLRRHPQCRVQLQPHCRKGRTSMSQGID